MNIFHCLDVSTDHVKPTTIEWLSNLTGERALGFSVAEYEYGLFITVPESTSHLPEELQVIVLKAQANNCAIILLDADGCVYEDLETFDWD